MKSKRVRRAPPQYATWQVRLQERINKNGPVPAHRPELGRCHVFTGSLNSYGYGHLSVNGRLLTAHRAMFLLTHGSLPEVVMHECDNPPCCNPEHLRAGTHVENVADMDAKGRRRPARGDANASRLYPERLSRGDAHYSRREPERMARGERHGNARVTAEIIKNARERFAAGGVSKAALARELGLSPSQMGRILRGESWQ
jgi:hypothetical protein